MRVFKKRFLKRIFGCKRDELTGELRKLHNGELNDLYCSHNIVRVINSTRMRSAEHVACMGERTGLSIFVVGNLKENDFLVDRM